jgi:hypothetical protein
MGVFSKFQKAKTANGPRVRFDIGVYLCSISGVKFDKTRKGDEIFAVSYKIHESNSSQQQLQPGCYADWAAMSSWDSYEGLVKDFICKLYGYTETELNALPEEDFEQLMNLLSGPEQAATGRLIRVECLPVTNKAGEDAQAVRFHNIEEAQQPEDQQA